ncbi:MAG TPA: EAL domain-containing protein, partial [Rhodospirillaceae bacterium]|nr:EAL domain-containing protein [Rhodospirillaceae bacterium]
TGYPREALIGHTPHLLASGRHDPDFYRSMWSEIGLHGFWRGEIWNRRKNGEVYPCLLTISAVTDPNEKVSHYVGTFSDITQVKAQQAHLELLAHYDPLTRLPNRVLLADRLSQAMAQAKRSNSLLAIGFLDLDGFKAVNDSLGHALGDRLLIEVSERLRAFLRGGDTIARMGGDEFVLVLSGLDSLQECDRAINRLLLAIAAPYTIQDDPIQLSASMGVTLYPNDGSDPDTLIRHADQAMYIAKQAGRNRYHLFDAEQDRQAHAQHEALGRLQQALDNQEFCLYYQPKVDMRSGLVYGAEALIRWNHPQQGLLAPGEFLPVIEGSHLAVPLGEWVIGAALKQLAVWHASGLKLSVSVNIAASHLQCGDFTERLRHSLASVAPELAQHLECEVLETAALENISGVAQIIKECSDLGVDFSLDDFGTGYSSLSYLKRLPAKTLKIDQSFVRTMLVDLEDLAIVEGVVGLTHIFHRQVVAEGVESAEHGIVLLQIGCDRAQGYGIARPMPADKIPDWVLSWRPDPRWSKPEALRLKREDFPLLAMETEHRAWVDRLIAFIEAEEGSQPPPPLSSRDCAFGRWYDGPGLLKYGPIDEFTALRDVHEQIHDFALDLINLAKSQGRRQARQGFPQLLALRDGLLARFETLKEAVAARSQE